MANIKILLSSHTPGKKIIWYYRIDLCFTGKCEGKCLIAWADELAELVKLEWWGSLWNVMTSECRIWSVQNVGKQSRSQWPENYWFWENQSKEWKRGTDTHVELQARTSAVFFSLKKIGCWHLLMPSSITCLSYCCPSSSLKYWCCMIYLSNKWH